jgi:sterol 3beta-glucosyltransferase
MRLRPLRNPLTVDANSPQLALYAMSRHVFRPPTDWPPHNHVTGFFFLDDEQWQPDAELVEFLEAGEPPVVFTFGSMTHEDPGAVTDLVLDVVSRVGCRAILHRGWSGLGREQMPPNVHLIGYVPYAWLFPRAACVVHHGGPGTAGAVFRAGVPHVFVPHAWDQPVWAKLAQELKCAGAPIPYTELSRERLETAITRTLATPHYYQAATALGEKIQTEQGVQKARQLIERLLDKIGLIER